MRRAWGLGAKRTVESIVEASALSLETCGLVGEMGINQDTLEEVQTKE